MSGDLISRSSLLQTLKYNKAINEDDAKGKMMVIPVDNVIEYVEKMPTAYNVDKVVEQLEADITCRGRLDGYIPKYKAIDIVKAGGVE